MYEGKVGRDLVVPFQTKYGLILVNKGFIPEKNYKSYINKGKSNHGIIIYIKRNSAIKNTIKIKFEPNNLVHYHFLTELKKDFLDSVLKEKILKILENKNNSKINLAYGNFILAKYERKNKNYKIRYFQNFHINN